MTDTEFSLTGRTAVVTGASRGIGAAVAARFASAGARVIAISRTGSTADAMIQHERCDIADSAARSALVARLKASLPSVHVLVNAAAISLPPTGKDDGAEIDRLRQTLEVNVVSAYALIVSLAPLLRAAEGASVINVTSINSVRGFPRNPGYVAAKAALAGLTRALAVDLADDHIRVNALAPGYVRTAMTEASYSDPALRAQRTRHTLLKRWGKPSDIASAALFLAADASAYITGQELFVDGGWTTNGLLE